MLTKFKFLIDEVFRAITKEEVESDKSDIPIDPVKDKKLKKYSCQIWGTKYKNHYFQYDLKNGTILKIYKMERLNQKAI